MYIYIHTDIPPEYIITSYGSLNFPVPHKSRTRCAATFMRSCCAGPTATGTTSAVSVRQMRPLPAGNRSGKAVGWWKDVAWEEMSNGSLE